MTAPALQQERDATVDAVAARLGELRQSVWLMRSPGCLAHFDNDIEGPTVTPEYPTTVPHGDDLTCALEEEAGRIFDDATDAGLRIGEGDDFAWVKLRRGPRGLEYAGVDLELGRLIKGRNS